MVDKATVMDVEPLEAPKRLPEMISIEIQTDPIEMNLKKTETDAADIKSDPSLPLKTPATTTAIPPPPPPPMMGKF